MLWTQLPKGFAQRNQWQNSRLISVAQACALNEPPVVHGEQRTVPFVTLIDFISMSICMNVHSQDLLGCVYTELKDPQHRVSRAWVNWLGSQGSDCGAKNRSADIWAPTGTQALKASEVGGPQSPGYSLALPSALLFVAPQLNPESIDPGSETQCQGFFFAV